MIEGDWRVGILPEYWNLRQELVDRYNNGLSDGENIRNGLREGTIGGNSFAGTLGLAMNRSRNAETVRQVHSALEAIIDRPNSGQTAWEMRRFIRRAPEDLIGPFGLMIKELAEKATGYIGIDMDTFYWETEWTDSVDIRERSQAVVNGLRWRIDQTNPDGTIRWSD